MDSFLAASNDEITACTGYSRTLILEYMRQFNIPDEYVIELCAAHVMSHMDVTDRQFNFNGTLESN